MRIELYQLRESPVAYDVVLSPDYLAEGTEELGIRFEPGTGRVIFTMHKERILAEGTLRTTVHLACGRCLEPATHVIQAPVHLYYWPEHTKRMPETVDIDVDEPDYALYSGEGFDPDEELRQILLLEMPSVGLCQADCKGLCPRCGTNLNQGECGCRRNEDDELTGSPSNGWKNQIRRIRPDSEN